jgi:hypothetical protein
MPVLVAPPGLPKWGGGYPNRFLYKILPFLPPNIPTHFSLGGGKTFNLKKVVDVLESEVPQLGDLGGSGTKVPPIGGI